MATCHQLSGITEHMATRVTTDDVGTAAQDTSTGQMVAQHRTRLGTCDVMRQNPQNAVLSLGHANGTVTLWSPNITTALIKMQCHRVRTRQCTVACRLI